jgi:protein TonB
LSGWRLSTFLTVARRMTSSAFISESRGARAIRWAGAAVVVIGVHAGGGFALLRSQEDDSPDVSGAIAIELAPLVTAPALKSEDLAPGPLMQEEAPSQETPKQSKETVAEETPRAEPSPLAPEPAVTLPEPQPEKNEKPEEKVEEKTTPEQASRQAVAAPMTTAPPSSEARPAETAAAPAPGLSSLAASAQASWQKSLVAHINRYKRYPTEARDHKMEGEVSVEFTLDARGNILSSRVAKSSGSSVFDEEALAILRRAAPLPAPPEQSPANGISLMLPIQFRIK